MRRRLNWNVNSSRLGLQVLVLDPVVRTAQPRLEGPEHLMDAGEDDLGAFWPALCLGPVSVALPAVRDHDRAWGNVMSHETGQRSSGGVGHRLEANPTRGPASYFDGTYDQRSIAQLPSASKPFLVTDIGLIHFYSFPKGLPLGSEHRTAQLLEHDPGGFVSPDSELTGDDVMARWGCRYKCHFEPGGITIRNEHRGVYSVELKLQETAFTG